MGASEEGAIADGVIERLTIRGDGASRYEVQGEVGTGGMGTILQVWDADLRRSLAMKVANDLGPAKDYSPKDSRALTRFIEEAQVTGQLDHPGIVPVHELGLDTDGRVYFTMRLVAGRDLEKIFGLVTRGEEGWSQTRAVGVLLNVCEAMAYAHTKGVVHRDLKPANIMVGGFGEVYVMDWGVAHVSTERLSTPRSRKHETALVLTDLQAAKASSQTPQVTMEGDVMGTPAYMPPEQARGDTQAVGPLSDIYSAGAILYQLLAGHMPYEKIGEKQSALDVWKLVRAGPPATLDSTATTAPPELIAICEKAMERDPAGRYSSMLELADDLRAYLEGHVVRAYEGGAIAEFRKWVGRNKALALTAALGTFLVTAGSLTASLVLANKNDQLEIANDTSRRNERRADEAATAATHSALLAERRAEDVLRLSDVKRLSTLRAEAEAMWPPGPDNEEGLSNWLSSARELVQRLTLHSATLHTLRSRAIDLDARMFASTEDLWQHDTLSDLLKKLREIATPQSGLIADVERRLEFASSVEELTRTGPHAVRLWKTAIDSYEGPSRLVPQLGLLPIGMDPESGLLEFAHLQSGTPAERDKEGQLILNEETGIVLVLIPGGTYWMGAQSDEPSGQNFSALATTKEIPPHQVAIEAFLLSKYELTQGQWLRTMGSNPSLYAPETSFGDVQHSLEHPVEQISWDDATLLSGRLGLVLPTEAQWERACRAGSETPWFTGVERASLEGYANLADSSVARAGENWPTLADWPELDDGYPLHAPVGSYSPNAFGLHDMSGNVWEWCRDSYGFYDSPTSGPDAERVATHPQFRINRGGSYYHTTQHARSSHRNNSAPETRQNHLGVRLARSLEE